MEQQNIEQKPTIIESDQTNQVNSISNDHHKEVDDQGDKKRVSSFIGKKREPLPPGMTRSQFKKQQRQASWAEKKNQKKINKKNKNKSAQTVGVTEEKEIIPADHDAPPRSSSPSRKKKKLDSTVPDDAVRVYLDCDWESVMNQKESKGVGQQIVSCYSDNKKALTRLKFRVTGLKENGIIHNLLLSCNGGKWEKKESGEGDVDNSHTAFRHHSLLEEAANENKKFPDNPLELIYLSADAEEELETIDNKHIYIIGGLLDHNRLKFATLHRAKELNIRAARLPIGKFVLIQRRHVLTINHVFAILQNYLRTNDWEKSLVEVLPKRMEAAVKNSSSNSTQQTNAEESSLDATTSAKEAASTIDNPIEVEKEKEKNKTA